MSLAVRDCIELAVEVDGVNFTLTLSKQVSFEELHSGLIYLLQEVTRMAQQQKPALKPQEITDAEWDYYNSMRHV